MYRSNIYCILFNLRIFAVWCTVFQLGVSVWTSGISVVDYKHSYSGRIVGTAQDSYADSFTGETEIKEPS